MTKVGRPEPRIRDEVETVDGGEHAFNCIRYIDLNMVRAGVVGHPLEWRWCGHDELVGRRRRYRLLDLECVLKWLKMERGQFPTRYADEIAEAVRDRSLRRDPVWTESVAVGGRAFVERVSGGLRNRRRLETLELSEGLWTVREAEAAYGSPGDGGGFLSRTPAPMVAEVSPQSARQETSADRD